MASNWFGAHSTSGLAIPCLEQANQCGGHGFSIFPKTAHGGLGSGTEYDCVLPIGVLYHCLRVSTAAQCIHAHDKSPIPSMTLGPGLTSDAVFQSGTSLPPYVTPRVSSTEGWVETAAYVVDVVSPTLLALGLVSNLLVLSIICCRRMRSGVNSFLVSSVLAQIFYIISVFLLRLVDYSDAYTNHIFHTAGRVYIHHFSYFFYLVVLWQILAAGIERVITGFTPDSAKRHCSPWRADVVNVFIWMAAFALVFPVLWFAKLQYVLGYAQETVFPGSVGSGSPLACSILYWFQLVFSIFIPYPTLLILIFLLVSSLLKQVSSMHKITLGSNGELWRQKVEEDSQLTRLVLVQVILFFLLTGPYAIGQLVLTLNLVPDRTVCMWSILIDLFHLGPLLYSSLQFILFGCVVEKFAVTFRNVCCKCCGKYD